MPAEKVMPFKTVRLGDFSGSLFRKASKRTGKDYVSASIQVRIPGNSVQGPTFRGLNLLPSQFDHLRYIMSELEKSLALKPAS